MAIEWLKSVYSNLLTIEQIIGDEFLTHIVAFHSQQAIEKSLKSILEFQTKNVPKIHKLQTLIDSINLNLNVNDEVIQLLDKLYIDSRYPGDFGLLPYGKPTLKDAQEFYDVAKEVFYKVCEILDVKEEDLQ